MIRKIISNVIYNIVIKKGILIRRLKWINKQKLYANEISKQKLPTKIFSHQSLIRRKLGNVNQKLQENKAVNLEVASLRIKGILIKPTEVFSFWKLVGKCTKQKGYKEGLLIRSGNLSQGIGGGLCQLTNLIHWIILHSPLTIIEHHHHNQIDMFPDYERSIPFGTGTSILYNYLDYQFVNNTNQPFQLIIYIIDDYLYGELRSNKDIESSYEIEEKDHYFTKEKSDYYRNNEVYRKEIERKSGKLLNSTLIVKSHAKVLYDSQFISSKILYVDQ